MHTATAVWRASDAESEIRRKVPSPPSRSSGRRGRQTRHAPQRNSFSIGPCDIHSKAAKDELPRAQCAACGRFRLSPRRRQCRRLRREYRGPLPGMNSHGWSLHPPTSYRTLKDVLLATDGTPPRTMYGRARSARGDGERPRQRAYLWQGRNSDPSKSQVAIPPIALNLSDAQNLIWMQAKHIGCPLELCDRASQRLLALGFKRANTRARETLALVMGNIPIRIQLAVSSVAHPNKITQCRVLKFLLFCRPVTCPSGALARRQAIKCVQITSDRHRMRCLPRTSRCRARSGLAISFLSSINISRLGLYLAARHPRLPTHREA